MDFEEFWLEYLLGNLKRAVRNPLMTLNLEVWRYCMFYLVNILLAGSSHTEPLRYLQPIGTDGPDAQLISLLQPKWVRDLFP